MTTQKRMPILFVPHGGGPLPLLGDPGHAGQVAFLQRMGAQLGKPKAILVVSAHWETRTASVTTGAKPGMIYDYGGFPAESYAIQYPAPGAADVGERVAELLETAGIPVQRDPERGYDHGVFVPLKVMYPDADVPVAVLSVNRNLDPAYHIALGRAIAQIRNEGVLIVGSGLSFHNLRAVSMYGSATTDPKSIAFNDWLVESVTQLDAKTREERLNHWADAPFALYCHPREEHLLPLHVCFGAAEGEPAEAVFNEPMLGVMTSGFLWK